MMNVLERVVEYYSNKIDVLENAVKGEYSWWGKENFDKEIYGALDICQFVQGLGVEYEEIAPLYDDFKEKAEKLEKEWLDNKSQKWYNK